MVHNHPGHRLGSVRPEVRGDVALAVAGRPELLVAVRTFEWFCSCVKAHVDLQTALGGETGLADVATETLLS